jgi:hypothetical protein
MFIRHLTGSLKGCLPVWLKQIACLTKCDVMDNVLNFTTLFQPEEVAAVSPKRYNLSTKLHSVTSQMTAVLIISAAINTNFIFNFISIPSRTSRCTVQVVAVYECVFSLSFHHWALTLLRAGF